LHVIYDIFSLDKVTNPTNIPMLYVPFMRPDRVIFNVVRFENSIYPIIIPELLEALYIIVTIELVEVTFDALTVPKIPPAKLFAKVLFG